MRQGDRLILQIRNLAYQEVKSLAQSHLLVCLVTGILPLPSPGSTGSRQVQHPPVTPAGKFHETEVTVEPPGPPARLPVVLPAPRGPGSQFSVHVTNAE